MNYVNIDKINEINIGASIIGFLKVLSNKFWIFLIFIIC